jgi:hypothetical protein
MSNLKISLCKRGAYLDINVLSIPSARDSSCHFCTGGNSHITHSLCHIAGFGSKNSPDVFFGIQIPISFGLEIFEHVVVVW